MIALYITTTGNTVVTDLQGLDDMQAAVGGLIEPVCFDGCEIWVNEEGLNIGLEVNRAATYVATQLAGQRVLLVGDVFVTGPNGPDGNSVDLPIAGINKIRQMIQTGRYSIGGR